MRLGLHIISMIVVLGVVANTATAGESEAVQTMTGILLKLNHFPSEADQQVLKRIVDDKAATVQERAVAQALSNVKHKVAADDKPKLEAVIDDQTTPASLKTLAAVILSLNHMPTDADKAKLQPLVP